MSSRASSRKQTKMIKVVTPILLLIVLYIFWNVYNNHKTKRSKLNLPPGSFGWPFLGETLALLRANWDGVPERFVQERIEKYGSPLVFKTSLLGERMAVLCGPAGNKFLFGNENKLVAVWWPFQVKKLFGRCLLTIRGDEAKCMRKMLLSYLGPDAFATHYVATMDVVTRRHIDVHWRGKEVVNVYQTVKLCSFELSCCLFMSLDKPNQIAKLASLFNTLLKGIIELPINFPGTRFYKSKKAVSSIIAELITIIKARRMELEEGKASSSQDLLSHLLTSSDENGRYLTEKDIAKNILLLLFAGHDTSTVTITLLMKCLAEHPRVYDKVLKEQLDICKAKETGELLKWEDIQNMRYSSNVVSEVLRLYPATSGTYREALVDIEYAGYTIPKGWKLHWSASSTHKDKANFEDPTRFDPSRFEGSGPKPFAFVPFGGGPRMCLGKEFSRLEVLTFLHNIVTNFKWDLLIHDDKIKYNPVPVPAKGLPIRIHSHQV
ncbi:putative cytochrome P450 [Helianthus annuus]|nr:putative cytochrome P450 [Helianthus annuus]KAJ0703163.1 putative cytochrome P450 [Helianthus annuus]